MKGNPFSPPQLRRIRITLQLLEETLRRADRLLADGDFKGILYSYKIHISFEKQRLFHDKIMETLAYIERLAKELGIRSTEYSVERIITGELGISWENLEECHSKHLKGYGELKSQAIEMVDPAIDHLVDAIQDISKLSGLDEPKAGMADKNE